MKVAHAQFAREKTERRITSVLSALYTNLELLPVDACQCVYGKNMNLKRALYKIICCVFTVEQSECIINVSEPNRRAIFVVLHPFLLNMTHRYIGQNRRGSALGPILADIFMCHFEPRRNRS